jgi:hypothetical protein
MKKQDEHRTKQLLRQAMPPVDPAAEPSRDLWPAVLRRIEHGPDAGHADPLPHAPLSVPFFDWALLAGLVIFAVSFPATIPVFLYYL